MQIVWICLDLWFYGFQRTEMGCSGMNSLKVCVYGGRPDFVFIPNTKRSQNFNETILETFSMPEKAFSSRITKTIKMKDAKIQKLWKDKLFREAKVVKFVSYLKLEFNIDFIYQGVFFCIHRDTFLNVKS